MLLLNVFLDIRRACEMSNNIIKLLHWFKSGEILWIDDAFQHNFKCMIVFFSLFAMGSTCKKVVWSICVHFLFLFFWCQLQYSQLFLSLCTSILFGKNVSCLITGIQFQWETKLDIIMLTVHLHMLWCLDQLGIPTNLAWKVRSIIVF